MVERQVGCVSASVRRNAFHGLVGFALPTVVLLASYLPARKAAMLNPMETLRDS